MLNLASSEYLQADLVASLLGCACDVLDLAREVAVTRSYTALAAQIEVVRCGALDLVAQHSPPDLSPHTAVQMERALLESNGVLRQPLARSLRCELPNDTIRTEVLASLIRQRFDRVGRAGALVLMRLLKEPDRYVRKDVLAKAAGVKAPTSKVVRVYISHIRRGLAGHGITDAISTERGSYRLNAVAVTEVLRLLQ
ncbi:hypothetical protein M2336_003518 [Sphingobium sp. B1D7B]|uniref:helix-turn-helix domain-containing protein n=1 Tax=Sphingobium sp. B1D7B TaxID=2940578 RepID=UPI0022248C78|nr:helix-turn-helix domain-containing protein [Sphingobium sp. B1D7B]MCW2406834.1 hypothetical protein [Sphingobium sp. B1D7B]